MAPGKIARRATAWAAAILAVQTAGLTPLHASSTDPSSAGTTSGAWVAVASAQGGADGFCAFTNTNSVPLVFNNFGFSLPSSASVAGIEVEVKLGSTSVADRATVTLLKSTGAPSDFSDSLAALGTTCGTSTFITAGGPREPWFSPGFTLKGSDLNDPGFGVIVSSSTNPQGMMFVDSVRVTPYLIPSVRVSHISPDPTDGAASLFWAADENGAYTVRVGGTDCGRGTVAASSTYSSTPLGIETALPAHVLTGGSNAVRVCLTNSDGNTGSALISVLKDATTPMNPDSLTSTTHSSQIWSASNRVGVRWSGAVDDLAVAGYSVTWDISPSTALDTTVDLRHGVDPHSTISPPLASGNSHFFHLRTCDSVGNCASTAHLGPFLVDTAAPSTAITSGPVEGNSTNRASATFTFTGSDAESGVASYQCSLDGRAFAACDSPLIYSQLGPGAHTFAARAVDGVGNVDSLPPTRTWVVDASPPDTTITLSPSSPMASTFAMLFFMGKDEEADLAGFECEIDGGGYRSCTSPQTYSGLAEGSHTFQVRAVDLAGNADSSPASATWVVDTTTPDTQVASDFPSRSASSAASFNFTGTDEGGTGISGFECRIDGGVYVACESPKNYSGLTDGMHTFQVRATDLAGNPDPTPATSAWTIDTAAPITSISTQPAGLSASANATFRLSALDPAGSGVRGFQCNLDSGPLLSCTSPVTYVGLAEGSHTFRVRAVDNALNVDSLGASFAWFVDTAPPEVSIAAGPPALATSSEARFVFAASDGAGSGVAGLQCQLDSRGFSSCTSPQNYTGLSDGSHTFEVIATDIAGNTAARPITASWVIDTAMPDTNITAAPSATSSSASPAFSFTGDDARGSGVTGYQCQLDGGEFFACVSPLTLDSLIDGRHAFEVRAVDASGNVDRSPATHDWTLDTIAPDTNIVSHPAAVTTSATGTFRFGGSDSPGSGLASFECDLDGAGFTACPAAKTFTAVPDGNHVLQVRSIDRAGNADLSPATFSWFIHAVGPETTLAESPSTANSLSEALFTFSGADRSRTGLAGFDCRLENETFAPCTSPKIFAGLRDGSHSFYVRAVDNAGNVDPDPVVHTWVIDTVEPDTQITTTPPPLSNLVDANFSFTGTDPGSDGVTSFECDLDGGGFAACRSPRTFSTLTDGSHTVRVRALDEAGNVDSSPAAYTWIVDTAAPEATMTTGPPNPTNNTSGTLTFAGVDAVSFECKLDGGAFEACVSPRSYQALRDGQHTFQARAIDAAGNVGSKVATTKWLVDTTAPAASITSNPANPTHSTSPSFSFKAEDSGSSVARFECELDSGGFSACTSPQAYASLNHGSHTFRVRSIDNAGNVEGNPPSYTWLLDLAEPDTSITAGPPNPSGGAPPSFSFAGSDGSGSGVTNFECQVDGGRFTPCTSPRSLGNLTDGHHTFAVRAIDKAGNVDSSPASYKWLRDHTAPETTLNSQPAALSKSTIATFEIGGTDSGSGVARLECKLDSGAFATCSDTVSYDGLTEGNHTFAARAIDHSGNVDSSPASLTWKVDLSPTIIATTITDGAPYTPGTWTTRPVQITYTCGSSSPDAIVASCATSTVVSTDGANQTRSGAVRDSAGRTATVAVKNINIDSSIPTLTASRGSGTYLVSSGSTLEVTLAASDRPAAKPTCTYVMNAAPSQVCGKVALAPGHRQLTVTATDLAGNQAALTREYRIIAVSLGSISAGLALGQNATITFGLTDDAPIASASGAVCLGTICAPFTSTAPGQYQATIQSRSMPRGTYPLQVRLTGSVVAGPQRIASVRIS